MLYLQIHKHTYPDPVSQAAQWRKAQIVLSVLSSFIFIVSMQLESFLLPCLLLLHA